MLYDISRPIKKTTRGFSSPVKAATAYLVPFSLVGQSNQSHGVCLVQSNAAEPPTARPLVVKSKATACDFHAQPANHSHCCIPGSFFNGPIKITACLLPRLINATAGRLSRRRSANQSRCCIDGSDLAQSATFALGTIKATG